MTEGQVTENRVAEGRVAETGADGAVAAEAEVAVVVVEAAAVAFQASRLFHPDRYPNLELKAHRNHQNKFRSRGEHPSNPQSQIRLQSKHQALRRESQAH